MCRGDNFYQFVIKKFSQLGDPMADDIVKQLSRQLAHPMVAVAKNALAYLKSPRSYDQ